MATLPTIDLSRNADDGLFTRPLRFMSGAATCGYAVTLVYVGVASAAQSLQRVRDRVAAGGHDVPIDAIMRRTPTRWTNWRPHLA